MKIIDNIKENQIEYLKSLNIPIIKFNIKYHSDKSIVYDIDIELNKRKFHIVVNYNWDFNKSGIHIYSEDKFMQNESAEIYNIDDLNKYVTNYILKNIYK